MTNPDNSAAKSRARAWNERYPLGTLVRLDCPGLTKPIYTRTVTAAFVDPVTERVVIEVAAHPHGLLSIDFVHPIPGTHA